MRLVSTNENDFGRLSNSQRPKSVGSDFSEEVEKQKLQFPDIAVKTSSKQQDGSITTNFMAIADDVEIDSEISQSEETVNEPVDEQSLAEGVKLFGSLFSLIEERLSTNGSNHGRSEYIPSLQSENGNSALKTEVDAPTLEIGTDAVVIDFAKMRGRAAANLKNRQDDSYQMARQAAIVERGSIAQPETPDKNAESRLAALDAPSPVAPRQKLAETEENTLSGDVRLGEVPIQKSDELLSPSQTLSSSASRVEQILRVVVEQAQQLVAARPTTGTRELNASVSGQTLRMSLHPLELGSLEISVSKRGKRLEVTVSPELEGTGRLLLEDAAKLARSLGASDANVEHVQVRILVADGVVETHDVSDVLQFSARQSGGQSSSDEPPSRPAHHRSQQREGSNPDGSWNNKQDSASGSQRQPGAVYI